MKPIKILYIDDEPSILGIFERIFSNEYEILTAENGKVGLQLFKKHQDIAVVLSDQRMPKMTGVELMEKIYELNPDPVRILVTAYQNEEVIIDAINQGHIFQYIPKPWQEEELRGVIERACYIYQLRNENKQLAVKLIDKNKQLQSDINKRKIVEKELRQSKSQIHQLTRELIRAQENERQKIGLDLHDNVAQVLSSLKLMIETMTDEIAEDPAKLFEWRQQITEVLQNSIAAVRDLSYNLRPPALAKFGLAEPLEQYCQDVAEKNQIRLDFHATGIESLALPYDTAINIYRLTQEAMNNVCQHAQANWAQVGLRATDSHLTLSVVDDGVGFDVETRMSQSLNERRMGLRSMEERVGILNGYLNIDSQPGKGTVVRVEVPVD